MTTAQLFFAIAGLVLVQTAILVLFVELYLNAKIDPLREQINMLIQYAVSHEGRIAELERQKESSEKVQRGD
jgi:Tfp pilus assembly protein PilN